MSDHADLVEVEHELEALANYEGVERTRERRRSAHPRAEEVARIRERREVARIREREDASAWRRLSRRLFGNVVDVDVIVERVRARPDGLDHIARRGLVLGGHP